MSCAGRGIVLRQIDRLFREGTLGGLGDGQLLERYLTRRDEDAFEALVDLHGPMVLGLCRRMLRDPRDIEDAFQATFLVLVRKAPAIRDRDLLSSWLYGVAYRVARRARTQTLRRRDRETTVGGPGGRGGAGDVGSARGRPGARSGVEPAAGEIPGALDPVLPAGADPRPGGGGAPLSGRDRPQPDGPGARPAPETPDAPGVRPDRHGRDPGHGAKLAGPDSSSRPSRRRWPPRRCGRPSDSARLKPSRPARSPLRRWPSPRECSRP